MNSALRRKNRRHDPEYLEFIHTLGCAICWEPWADFSAVTWIGKKKRIAYSLANASPLRARPKNSPSPRLGRFAANKLRCELENMDWISFAWGFVACFLGVCAFLGFAWWLDQD